MFTPRTLAAAAAVVLASLLNAARAEPTLTYPDLVNRLTDLARLATLPDCGETCAQWSSYDRASRYDEKTGKYIAWDANGDGGGVIRTRGRPGGDGRDERPGLYLADLVGRARQGTRQDLPGRPAAAGPSTCRLPTTSTASTRRSPTRPCPTTWPRSSSSGQNLYLSRSPIRNRARCVADKGWGNYLPLQLRDLSGGNQGPDLQCRGWPPNTPIG